MIDLEEPPLISAIKARDLPTIERLIASGADPNMLECSGDPALFTAVSAVEFSEDGADRELCMQVIQQLIDVGGDLCALDSEGGSILVGPIFSMQPELIKWLLKRGVDPNHGCCEPHETVYDTASFDYHFEAWMKPQLNPLNPPKPLLDDEDGYLAWLDREAEQRGYLRPGILQLLRSFGALSGKEIATTLGGSRDQAIKWTEDGWMLAS